MNTGTLIINILITFLMPSGPFSPMLSHIVLQTDLLNHFANLSVAPCTIVNQADGLAELKLFGHTDGHKA